MKVFKNVSTYSNYECFHLKKYKICDQCLRKLSKKLWIFVERPMVENNHRPLICYRTFCFVRLRFVKPLEYIIDNERLFDSSVTPPHPHPLSSRTGMHVIKVWQPPQIYQKNVDNNLECTEFLETSAIHFDIGGVDCWLHPFIHPSYTLPHYTIPSS